MEDDGDIEAVLGGSRDDAEAAYARLIRRHQVAVAAQMRRFTRCPTCLEDLVHEVFVQAYLALPGYRAAGPWAHWLRVIAVRVGYAHWQRRDGRDLPAQLGEEEWRQVRGEGPLPERAAEAADLAHRLLALLPEDDRLVLTLIYLDGCTLTEAAASMGWSPTNTKVRAHRARARLRRIIEERGDVP